MNKLVYMIGDDIGSRQNVLSFLRKEGFEVVCFENSNMVFEAVQQKECALVIFDVVTASSDDFVMCAKIKHLYDPAIIMLTTQMTDDDYVFATSLGVDNCLAKPFSNIRLIAYIRALLIKSELLRIKQPKPKPVKKMEKAAQTYGDITICSDKIMTYCNGKELRLTNTEFNVLTHMFDGQDKAISREELRDKIWGNDSSTNLRATDDTVKRLRKKLTGAGSQVSIDSVWGFGFRLGVKNIQERHEMPLEFHHKKAHSF